MFGRHKHDWEKWEETGTCEIRSSAPPLVQMFTKDPNWFVIGEMHRQERRCNSCGKTEIKTSKVYY